MKATRLIVSAIVLLLAGCGPSAAERAAQESKRLELEEQAQRDAQRANQAITNMNKKLGRKPPELDLGVATATKTQAAPDSPSNPEGFMEIYLPTLESKMVALVAAFRFIVFSIMVVGLVVCVAGGKVQGTGLFSVLAKAIVIVAAVAFMDTWFPKVEQVFLTIAEYVDPGYNANPTSASDTIRESTTANPEGQEWSWRKLNQSIYQAMSNAMANIFIYVGTLITVPMLILQYVLRWLLYLITPFMLALLMVPGFSGITVRFFQQMLAIMAWPVGFALTNLVALAVWTDFRAAVGANPSSMGDALYSPLLTFMGGILATIMIIVGMLSTPVVMQALFAQGHAFTGASGNFAHIVSTGSRVIYGLGSRMERSGPVATVTPSASSASAPPPTPPPVAAARPGI